MCMSAPKVPQVQAAPPPAPPAQAPIEEAPVSDVETAVTKEGGDEVAKKRVMKRGTKSLQTSSGLNIPTTSGLNIS